MKYHRPSKERIIHQHLALSGGIDLLQAEYFQQHFNRHSHDGYAFGIITGGQLDFFYQHKNWHAIPGSINLTVPGEVHDGQAKDTNGWSYRMIYLPARLLQEAARQLTGRDTLPWFLPGCIDQSPLAFSLSILHNCLADPAIDVLQKESALLYWLTAFIEAYGEENLPTFHLGQEPLAISRSLAYLQENFTQPISLQALADIAKLSKYHLLRTFVKVVGMPPHLYQQQLRIQKAKVLLAAGNSAAAVAIDTGFVDQSHFSRQFKKITGLTPSLYKKTMS
ncbi:MAG: AraC family ligand binding domain-containing protein [Selenomonadaceae bacterium]